MTNDRRAFIKGWKRHPRIAAQPGNSADRCTPADLSVIHKQRKEIDKVNFIHTESEADLIVFLSCDEDTEFGIGGFTIIRTPKYEFALSPYERRACIHWDEETDIREIIKEISFRGHEITFVSNISSYQFDISKVSKEEINNLLKTIDRMNFDGSIKSIAR